MDDSGKAAYRPEVPLRGTGDTDCSLERRPKPHLVERGRTSSTEFPGPHRASSTPPLPSEPSDTASERLDTFGFSRLFKPTQDAKYSRIK